MRRDWENLFHIPFTVPIGRIVENRDAGKFGNRFFEQLQPLTLFDTLSLRAALGLQGKEQEARNIEQGE
jgi:hypothetical protein